MIQVSNEIKDAERQKSQLEVDVKTMKQGIKHQQKYLHQLTGDMDYEGKLDMLKQELEEVKAQYKAA